jgi:hypothetical protein
MVSNPQGFPCLLPKFYKFPTTAAYWHPALKSSLPHKFNLDLCLLVGNILKYFY